MAALLESVDSAIVVCDRQGRLTFFNQVARDLHGMGEQPLGFERWPEHYHLYRSDETTLLPFDEVPLYRALNGETVQDANMVVRALDGTVRHVQAAGRPVLDGEGKVLGAVVSMHDVTASRDARLSRARAESETQRRVVAEESAARLRKAQEQVNLATDAAQLGIWTWNLQTDTGTWENTRMFDIFNVPSQQANIRNAHVSAFLDTQELERFQRTVDEAVRSGERFHFIGRFRRLGDQALRWIELTGVRQTGVNVNAVILIGTAADITAQRTSEEALKEAALRFDATLSAAEVATWIWDIPGDRIVADSNLTRLFGVSDALAPAAPLALYAQSIHPDDRDYVGEEIQRAIDERTFYSSTYRVRGTDGQYRTVIARGRVVFDAQDRPQTLAGVALDIPRQTEAQAALQVAQERYRTLISSMDEAFGIVKVLLDDSGSPFEYRFEEVNQAMELQSGLVQAAGKTIREMVPDIEQFWIDTYGRVALSRQPERFIEHSAAMGYWWDVYAAPIGAPEDLQIAIIFTDITARKKAEDDLRQIAADLSEANRRKTEFLATLAHELRNPLAPVRSGLDLLYASGDETHRRNKVLGMMDRQIKHMVHLIDDLLDISRINSGKIVLKRVPTTLQAIVGHAVDATRPALDSAHHLLDVHLPPAPLTLNVDPTRMVQVLANLLTNAAKYTPDGGRITLSASVSDDVLRLAVQDTGIGIPAHQQQQIFEMFSQVPNHHAHAQGGLGIGLALVRTLVELHGGTVKAASPGLDQGATFTITLPISNGATIADYVPHNPAANGQQGGSRLTIVIADDNRDAADVLASLLELEGHVIHVVHDGVAALQKILDVKPDLGLVDIGMPGLNGYEVAAGVRRVMDAQHIMLTALTGWSGEDDQRRAQEAGFDSHLTKPVTLDDLRQLVQRCVSRHQAARLPPKQ